MNIFDKLANFINEFFTYGWRTWVALGFVLLLFEGVDPGTLAPVFLAIGAFATAAITAYFQPLGVDMQLVTFAVASVICLLGIRPFYIARFFQGADRNIDAEISGKGQAVKVLSGLTDSCDGTVQFQGSQWQARTYNHEPLPPNDKLPDKTRYVKVVQIDGTTLIVADFHANIDL